MYTSPRISSQKVRNYQDESSDNDSYGSILTTGTETSTGIAGSEDQEQLNDLPPQFMYPTYGSAAAKVHTSPDCTHMSSPTASSYTDWQSEKRELEELIRQQAIKIDKIQADLNAKVSRSKDLEEQLAQAIELAHSRDARHEEMLRMFEQMMSMQAANNTGNGPPPPPAMSVAAAQPAQITPPSRPMNTQSPPPKKTNQSSTPPKSMYPVFRQYEHNPSRFKRPQAALLTQPMETDDRPSKAQPGEKAGTNQ